MKVKILTILIATLFGSFAFNIARSESVHAACGDERFLTMPAWYRGLSSQKGDNCEIDLDKAPADADLGGSIGPAIYIIALNVAEMMMHIAAYVSIAFVIVGGYRYMVSASNPDVNARGRKTIINALIGLVISVAAIGIVNLLFQATQKGGL